MMPFYLSWLLTTASANGTPLERLVIKIEDNSIMVAHIGDNAYVPLGAIAEALDAKVENVNKNTLSLCVGEVCQIIGTDGTDPRIALANGEPFVALGALPEFFDVGFQWNAGTETLRLVPAVAADAPYVSEGEKLPEIVLPNMDGEPVSLSSFHGKKVILFTWASW